MDKICINCDEDTLLFDLSYFVFYRYYATVSWLKKNTGESVDVENIMTNTVFLEKYCKLFEKNICDIVKSSKVSWKNVFLVKDCFRDNIWRNDFYNYYKATRNDRTETFNKNIFIYTYNELLPALESKYGFKIINHPRLEADDVIAIIKESIRCKNSHVNIYIITNDNDYIQLIDANTFIKNIQGKEIKYRVGMLPDIYLKTKIIMGDKSDNIPCIMKKIGPKTAEKFVANDDMFIKFCEKHPDALKQYNLNKLLIDFEKIPIEIKNDFKERLEIKY